MQLQPVFLLCQQLDLVSPPLLFGLWSTFRSDQEGPALVQVRFQGRCCTAAPLDACQSFTESIFY